MKCSVVLSIVWLFYALPQAIEYGESVNTKLLATGIAIGVGAAILLAGLICELINNEIKKRMHQRHRRGD